MSKRKIYFRADASADIGYGHFVRTLALADMLKDDFECVFVTQSPTDYQRLEVSKVCALAEVPATDKKFGMFLELLQGDEIVVLDNYFYDTDYQQAIKDKGCRLVCIDDMHDKHYVADVVINHALGFSVRQFSVEPYTQLCLGQSYALLRKPFLDIPQKIQHEGNHVFICFGGADIYNLTCKFVDSIIDSGLFSEIYTIVGDAYQHRLALEQYKSRHSGLQIFSNIDARAIADLLLQTDLAIVPASSIMWEALSRQVRCIYGYYVDNQIGICNNLGSDEKLGVRCIGDFREVSGWELSRIAGQELGFCKEKSRNLFWGRAANHIRNVFFSEITVRPAQTEDLQLYFQWVNDPDVRNSAFHTEPVDLVTHRNWFESKLADPAAFLYLCYFRSRVMGQVRFEVEDGIAVIDISVDKAYRGKELSVPMLQAAMNYFSAATGYRKFRSEVKKENISSQKLFLKAGFTEGAKGSIRVFFIETDG